MTGTEILALTLSAMAAGAINAVAGGGTLLTFPALLSFGVPGVIANATSTVALVVGTGGSVFGFRRLLPAIRHWLWRFLPVSLAGGWLGSALLTRTKPEIFENSVPFLILFATVLFMVQGVVRRLPLRVPHAGAPPPRVWPSIIFQFFVALYGGYFGAGIGILMLASFGFIGMHDIHEMNALKNVLGSLINVVAALVFLLSPGLVDWPRAAVMAAGALAGYYLGSHYSQKIPQPVVRRLITVIGLFAFALTAWRQFGG